MPKRHHSAHDGPYSGHDERRALEARDSEMIGADHSAIANMPQEVKMHTYPDVHEYSPETLNDKLSGVDHQIGEDNAKKHKHMHPKKI